MTARDRDTLKTYFETGDTPTQVQFSDWFDSIIVTEDDCGSGVTDALSNVINGSNGLVQLNGTSQLPAIDGSLLTGIINNLKMGSNSGSSLSAQITALSSVGRIEIVDNETISSDLTIPAGVTLVAAGGVLTVDTGVSLYFDGTIEGHTKLFDNLRQGTWYWRSPQWCDWRWFGALPKNVTGADAQENADAFCAAWHASRQSSGGVATNGAPLFISPGSYDVNGFELSDEIPGADNNKNHYNSPIIGWGAIFWLPSGQNKPMMVINVDACLKEAGIFGLQLQGNSNGNTMDVGRALLEVTGGVYSFAMDGVQVSDSAGDAISLTGQGFNLGYVKAETSVGWGLVLNQCYGVAAAQLDLEYNQLGNLRVVGNSSSRQISAINIQSMYMENDPDTITDGQEIGVQIEGAAGVRINSMFTSSTSIVRLTNNGIWYANNNYINIEEGSAGNCQIDEGCYGNEIVYSPRHLSQKIFGSGGKTTNIDVNTTLNKLTVDGSAAYEIKNPTGNTSPNLFTNSNLADEVMPADWVKTAGSVLYAPAAYSSSITDVAHVRKTTTGNFSANASSYTSTLAGEVYYFQVLAACHPNARLYVRIFDGADVYYRWQARTWETGVDFGSDDDRTHALPVPPFPTLLEIPIFVDIDGRQVRPNLVSTALVDGASVEIYYVGLSKAPRQRLNYKRAGVAVGYNDHVEYAFASLPSAALFSKGTQVWVTDRSRYAVSNGTNWLDYDGTTMA